MLNIRDRVAAWVSVGLVGLAALSFQGCESAKPTPRLTALADGTPAFSQAGLVTDTLGGQLLVDMPILGDPRYMAVVGSDLWIADRSGDPFLHMIDLRTDSLVFSRGRSGEGPGDFGATPRLSVRPGDDGAVWAYDLVLRRLTREPDDSAPDYRVIKAFGDQVESTYSLQWQAPNRFVGIGDMDTNRIMLADSTGELVAMVPNALMGPDSVPLVARRAISSGYVMCLQPGDGRIAILYLAGGQIDL